MVTKTLSATAHPLSILPGAENAPVVFRRAAINRAIGMVKSYRSNRKRWEALPEHKRGKPPAIPTIRSLPVTLYKGMALLVRAESRSFLKVKSWERPNLAVRRISRCHCSLPAGAAFRG